MSDVLAERIEGHEKVCAERYASIDLRISAIGTTITELKKIASEQGSRVCSGRRKSLKTLDPKEGQKCKLARTSVTGLGFAVLCVTTPPSGLDMRERADASGAARCQAHRDGWREDGDAIQAARRH